MSGNSRRSRSRRSNIRSIVASSSSIIIIFGNSRRSARTGPVQLDFEREGEIAVEDARAGSGGGHAEVGVGEEGEGEEGETEVESEAAGGEDRWWVHVLSVCRVARKMGGYRHTQTHRHREREREREDNAHLISARERGGKE